ncbi:MAG TPA: glycine dehydrogenase, partial [Acholeplasmataceae bacterium]|nr:glycine dehydrogenase [Acholeplasmataceae bacterium]
MFKYFPHTEQDIQAMLEKIGVNSLDDLFAEIPSHLKITQDLNLPNAMSEIEIRKHIRKLGNKNQEFISFLGAGSYDVYTPAVIGALTSRQEFLTSYTPYQPEISQGTLTYIFEFQSMICELTGMDVSNASVYDGATATAESMFMAISQTKRNKVLVSSTIN